MVFSSTTSSSTYTPTYYSSVHDRITSLCKTILPSSSISSSLKKMKINRRCLPPGSCSSILKSKQQQSENLKWQQDSFHRILNLIGLRNEGIIQEMEVSVFRSQLLETLIASPTDQEEPTIIRDKLLFLQELFYAKCISEDEYHSSKRPLLQRLAVQGAEIEARDVIVAAAAAATLPRIIERKLLEGDQVDQEEWTDIDFKDEECLMMMGKENINNNNKMSRSSMKRIKGGGMIKLVWPSYNTSDKNNKEEKNYYGSLKEQKDEEEEENPFWDKKEHIIEKPVKKKKKNQWGFDVGFKKW